MNEPGAGMNVGLILEDMHDAQAWLQSALEEAVPGRVVHVTGSVAQASAALKTLRPDIALVDLGLPDGSGIEVLRRLTASHPTCLRIVTTIFDGDQHLFPALRAGAQGYVLKDRARPSLVSLLQGIADGQPPLSPSIARRLLGFFAPSPDHVEEVLTPREVEVLTLIAKGYTSLVAAELLGLSRHTVAGYVKDIYRKLNVSTRAEAALEASRRGIVGSLGG